MTDVADEQSPAPTVAERVSWLFEVMSVRVESSGDGEARWRPYSNDEVGRGIGASLGVTDVAACVDIVDRVRAGGSASDRELAAIAAFFDAPRDYFGIDVRQVAAAQDILLTRALRECDVETYRLCRGPVITASRRRELVRLLLEVLRRFSVSTEQRSATDFPILRTEGSSTCHDRGQVHDQQVHSFRLWSTATGGTVRISQHRPMNELQLRGLCQQMLRDLDILPPLVPEDLCDRLSTVRGRPIKLMSGELNTTPSVGHLFVKRQRDLIGYHQSAPREQQVHVIYHEVMHLVLDHLGGAKSLTCGALEESSRQGPGLYSEWQEWEAEVGATILSELSRQRSNPRLIAKDSRTEQGIAAAFGLSARGWQ